MSFPWFRFYHEALHDRKIARACRISGQPKATVIGTWLVLLCLANDSPERGRLMISDDLWLTEDEVLAESGLDPVTFGKIIDAFQRLNMVSKSAGFEILNWDKRQFQSDNSTERVRRHRKRKRNETLQKRSGNVLDTEGDIDTEEEGEHPPDYLAIWQTATGTYPGTTREATIADRLGDSPDVEALTKAARLWLGRGYSAFNIDGICDWYENVKREPSWNPSARNFNGPSEADFAWSQVHGEIQRVGSRETPEFEGATAKAVRQAGGYKALCQMPEREAERTFRASYQEAT